MGILKTEGVIVSSVRVGESDNIVTILTPENGLIQASARGVRRPGNALAGAVQLFTYAEYNVFTSRTNNYLNSGSIINSFGSISLDIEKCTYAAHFCKILTDIIQQEQKAPKSFRLLLCALYSISTDRQELSLTSRCFEFKLLCIQGYMPELDSCVNCGGELDGHSLFDFNRGGALCEVCRVTTEWGIHHSGSQEGKKLENISLPVMGTDILNVLRYIARADIKMVFSFNLKDELLIQLNRIVPDFLAVCFERRYTTPDFLTGLL